LPNQFGFETEQERKARLVNERMMADGIPPLDIIPQATPVGALKNRTALQNQFSPEATNILEQTPVNLRFTKEPALEGVNGFYNPRPNYMAYPEKLFQNNDILGVSPGGINVEGRNDAESTLAHEFAHAWQDQHMNPQTNWLWGIDPAGQATPHANERVATDYAGTSYDPNVELYATGVEQGPWKIPEETRKQFYGMYRDNITQPQPSPPTAMQLSTMKPPDLAGLRSQYFGTANWVPEYNVDSYNSHGLPIKNPKLGIPTIYQQPFYSGYLPGEVRGG
jgi:hypothetical protein